MATEPIYEVTIVGLERDKRIVLDALHTSAAMQIRSVDIVAADAPLPLTSEIAQELLSTKWMREQLKLTKDARVYSGATIEQAKDTFASLKPAYEDLRSTSAKLTQMRAELEALTSRKNLIESIPFELPKGIKLPHKGPRTFAFLLAHDGKNITRIFDKNQVTIENENGFTLISGTRAEHNAVRERILENDLKSIELEVSRDRKSEIAELEAHINAITVSMKNAERHLAALRAEHAETILTLDRDLTVLHSRYETPSLFGKTASTFVIQGFVPASDIDSLKRIGSVARIDITIEKATSGPIKLANPPYAKRFEFITRMFGLPKYGTTDPTMIVSLFLPLFFGFMFSDVGYGLLLLAAAFWLSKKATVRTPILSDSAFVLSICAASTIAFGLAFGSFFGELIPLPAFVIDPFLNAQAILIAAVALGFVHINIGLAIAAYEHLKHKRFAQAAVGPLAYVSLQIGAVLLAFGYAFGWGAIALCAALLFARSRIMGLMEITGFIGTLFSYARLLALALATAGIALGVNIIAERISAISYVGPLLFVLFVIVGHLFNFALNVLGSSIHSVRLHYIEFFSQFYESGGEAYRPFETDEKQYTL